MQTITEFGPLAIEQEIIKQFVQDALAAGFELSVDNGGDEDEIERSRDETAILGVMQEASEDTVYLYKPGAVHYSGFVYFVYGNEGWDVICNHTDTKELGDVLAKANALADKYES